MQLSTVMCTGTVVDTHDMVQQRGCNREERCSTFLLNLIFQVFCNVCRHAPKLSSTCHPAETETRLEREKTWHLTNILTTWLTTSLPLDVSIDFSHADKHSNTHTHTEIIKATHISHSQLILLLHMWGNLPVSVNCFDPRCHLFSSLHNSSSVD